MKEKLNNEKICCYDWRALFRNAHDSTQIALLPFLIKKIPTFDFALIIAEGVDETIMRGGSEIYSTMRDNVIFEIGLCVMGLGVEHVILLADETVHLPEDLVGIHAEEGIKYITFNSRSRDNAINKVEETIDKASLSIESFEDRLKEISMAITQNTDLISPVFIGAAVSSAESYFLNLILRLMEHTDNGFHRVDGDNKKIYSFPENFELKIFMPTVIDSSTRGKINACYKNNNIERYIIDNAGSRSLEFRARFDEESNSLTIIDIPTSITASYSIVTSILELDADDDYDESAEERFICKEKDVYAFALKRLIQPEVADRRISAFYKEDNEKKKAVLDRMKNVSIIENVSIEDIKI